MQQSIKNIRRSATAFSWDSEGRCRAVRLLARNDRIELAAFWQADTAPKSSTVAEAFATGRRELKCQEDEFVLLAPPRNGWGTADVRLPALSQEETRAALEFELRKCTPIPAERLVWGYRQLPSPPQENRLFRIVYARSDNWRQALKTAEGLGHLDLICPPAATLDPLLGDKTVLFPDKQTFAYLPAPDGRQVLLQEEPPAGAELASLLPLENLEQGPLAPLPELQKREFLGAILLAAYGLTRESSQDVKTLPAVPDILRPKRHLFAQYAAVFLAIMGVAFLGIGLLRGVQNRREQIRILKAEINKVESTTSALRKQFPPNAQEAAKALEAELLKYQDDTPSLDAVLCELTRIIRPPSWLGGGFEWKAAPGVSMVPITFTLKEPMGTTENQELSTRLNISPILGDAKEIQSMVGRNNLQERRFSLNARLDIGDERRAALDYAQNNPEEKPEPEEPPREPEPMEPGQEED